MKMKVQEKKRICIESADSPPVTVLTTKTNGEQKVNNETMTVKFNLGLFEYMKSNIGAELKERYKIETTLDTAPMAETDLFGCAQVEVQGKATFVVDNKIFNIKVPLYNTEKCTMFLQKFF